MRKAVVWLLAVAFLFLAVMATKSVAAAGTGYTVVVSGDVPIWISGANVAGQWSGGGSLCGTSMDQPKPPPYPGAHTLLRFIVTGGGPGTYAYGSFNDQLTGESVPAGTNTFAIDALGTVVYSIDEPSLVGQTLPLRVTFNYAQGTSVQNVVGWLGVGPGVYAPVLLIHNAQIVINTVG